MPSVSLSSTAQTTFSLYSNSSKKNPYLHLLALTLPPRSSSFSSGSSSLSCCYNPLRSFIDYNGRIVKPRRSRGFSAVCYAASLTARNLQWISAASSVVLILARGTAIPKSFLVPLFALQAPAAVVAWIKGRYGVWSAFLALLVRELELPFVALLLVMLAPYEVMKLRGTQEGAIISLLIAGYLAFQHFSITSLQKAFDQGSIVATLAVICITVSSI